MLISGKIKRLYWNHDQDRVEIEIDSGRYEYTLYAYGELGLSIWKKLKKGKNGAFTVAPDGQTVTSYTIM